MRCTRLRFGRDGRLLAVATDDHRVAVLPVHELFAESSDATQPPPQERLALRWLEGHQGPVLIVGWSRDGKYLASGSDRGVVIFWDGQTFQRVVTFRGDTGQVRCLSFSIGDRYLASAAYAAPAIVWDLSQIRATLREMQLDW